MTHYFKPFMKAKREYIKECNDRTEDQHLSFQTSVNKSQPSVQELRDQFIGRKNKLHQGGDKKDDYIKVIKNFSNQFEESCDKVNGFIENSDEALQKVTKQIE
jgi:Rps23 Pro-64 3,4-dihydroxylase Tpa1-like proline 4-hydroxylase